MRLACVWSPCGVRVRRLRHLVWLSWLDRRRLGWRWGLVVVAGAAAVCAFRRHREPEQVPDSLAALAALADQLEIGTSLAGAAAARQLGLSEAHLSYWLRHWRAAMRGPSAFAGGSGAADPAAQP